MASHIGFVDTGALFVFQFRFSEAVTKIHILLKFIRNGLERNRFEAINTASFVTTGVFEILASPFIDDGSKFNLDDLVKQASINI